MGVCPWSLDSNSEVNDSFCKNLQEAINVIRQMNTLL